jgi:hypothetical protein
MFARRWLAMAATLLVACAGKSEGSSPMGGDAGGSAGTAASTLSACDPLAASTASVQLDASLIVAAGEAKDGTVYVIYSDNRLFVGSGKQLEERVFSKRPALRHGYD